MKVNYINPQNIFGETFLDFDDNYLKQLIASIELIRRGNINGRAFSNLEFGWQSNFIPESGPFEKLTQSICKEGYSLCKNIKDLNFTKIKMSGFWANINYKGDINWPHNHQGDIAGVFYLQVPEKSGSLFLHSYNYSNSILGCHLQNSKGRIEIKPIKNKLVLFNACCYHYVGKSLSAIPRVSMSFNLDIN